MRVGPIELCHRACQLDRLVGAEFGGKRVVRIKGPRPGKQACKDEDAAAFAVMHTSSWTDTTRGKSYYLIVLAEQL